MENQFWHKRWKNNQIGFHQNEINSYLQQFWSHLHLPTGSHVFVPLCGKSRDMLWLREQGYKVLGIEISPIAVEGFFNENRLEPTVTTQRDMQRWACDDLVILCGDFFSLQPEDVAGCNAVYDRASLIAMPPAMRPAYAEKLLTLFPSPEPVLLVTMEYPQDEMNGPPFSVQESEVNAFYADTFQIRNILTKDILQENPHFKEKGATQMTERVYLLQPAAQ